MATQRRDGRWPQNYFPSGEPFWTGMQLDEAAFPVLLAAKLRELGEAELPGTAQMVRAAIGFIARTGPSSEQDRWEENPGVSPFTLAIAISALVAAAPWLTPPRSALMPRAGGRLERAARGLVLRARYGAGASSSAWRATTCASPRPINRAT